MEGPQDPDSGQPNNLLVSSLLSTIIDIIKLCFVTGIKKFVFIVETVIFS